MDPIDCREPLESYAVFQNNNKAEKMSQNGMNNNTFCFQSSRSSLTHTHINLPSLNLYLNH